MCPCHYPTIGLLKVQGIEKDENQKEGGIEGGEEEEEREREGEKERPVELKERPTVYVRVRVCVLISSCVQVGLHL